MSKIKDALGDKLKEYEMVEAGRRCMKGLPIVARLDGRAFSSFTKGLARPYDIRMSAAMVETTKYLVATTGALIGYCQSDEISLLYFVEADGVEDYAFSGRFQKLTSILASTASVMFYSEVIKNIPEKADKLPVFDCRIMQLPTKEIAAECFKWRELDATKNAVSMAAHSMIPHKELEGLKGWQKQELMFSRFGVNFNDYPVFFKRGTYVRKEPILIPLDEETRNKIPADRRPPKGFSVIRNMMAELDWEPCTKYDSVEWTNMIFGDEPN
jgi:tRNA(His) 5'-end guanylyltransferase